MEQSKIDRINALAKKAKTEGLTEAETAERKALREEYIAAYRKNLRAQRTCALSPHPHQRGRSWRCGGPVSAGPPLAGAIGKR